MTSVFMSKPSVLCSAGYGIEEVWEAVTSGSQKGIKKVKALNGKEFFAGRIEDSLLEKTSSRYDMRIIRIEEKSLEGLSEKISLVIEKYGRERIGVCVGSCDNGTELSLKGHRKYLTEGAFDKDYSLEIQGADYVSTFISEKFGVKGPSMTFSTACSSSAGAIIKAAELIRAGICDAVIAGGVDIASDTVLMGFDSLEAVSAELTNPFSANRHGITLGEAGAFFVLSKDSLDDEKVVLLGYGESADAYHMTSPEPSGNGAKRAMTKALEMAGIKSEEVDYLNTHGTGTKFNDSMEAKAIDEVFGEHKVPSSTIKPITGHTLGAAGALEAAVCWECVVKNKNEGKVKLPVQVWDEVKDPEMPSINIISKNNNKNTGKVKICMSNSFAFGGANSSLVIGVL